MKNLPRFLLTLGLVIGASIGSPQPCAADTVVTLRGETEVRRVAVRLSDVFTGVPAEIDRDIAQSPAPGKQVTYDVNVLTRLANKYRLDWEPQSYNDHTVITTACTRISADMIRDAVVRKIKDGQDDNRGNIDVSFDNHALEVDLPADQGAEFTLANFNYDIIGRRFSTNLMAQTAGGPFSVPVTGRITVKRNIPVLNHRLEGGTVIGAADINFVAITTDKINASVITEARDLIGRELRRDTDADEVLHTHDIIPPRFVTRGSLITLKIETPFMLLTAQGKALQDGSEGDVVRVLNTQSNRMLEGTVAGPGTVLIHTTQKMAAAQ